MTPETSWYRACVAVVALGGILFVAGCSTTKLTGVWSDPALPVAGYSDYLVVAVGGKESSRRLYEDTMSRAIAGHPGASAIASHRLAPAPGLLSKADIQRMVADEASDAIVVTRLVDVDKSLQYVPGATYTVPTGYSGFYGYYSSSFAVVREPGYYRTATTLVLETNVYNAGSGRLVWSAVSETLDPASAESLIDSVTSKLVKRMAADGLLN